MKKSKCIFSNTNATRGSMLIELLLSVALAAIIIPFVFRYQQNAVIRAQNIVIANNMTEIQVALERYIVANRTELLRTVGRNITRVELSELESFGLPPAILESDDGMYQLRILKSGDASDQSSLQGVVVRVSDDISPLRTREIVNLSGGSMGFVDGTHAYGTFGAWHTDSIDLGVDIENGIVETTPVSRDSALYLWRIPSEDPADAQMMSALNLGGHDIKNISFINGKYAEFSDGLTVDKVVSNRTVFSNRTTIDSTFSSATTTVSGMLSSDGKDMEISGALTLSDLAKMSSLTAENLWVSNLTLGGVSIDSDMSVLKINQSLDMTSGRIEAMFVSVGYAGSITPRLEVYDRITDSVDPNYFWDVSSNVAHFSDVSLVELNRMATLATKYYGDTGTASGQIFGAVSANKNATAADYMNAIHEIQHRVVSKYEGLQLR